MYDSPTAPSHEITRLQELMDKLQRENKDLRELVQTLEVRDTRLGKVDQMQSELDSLIKRTDEDKKRWKKKESELV